MTLHIPYDHTCEGCGAYYIPYDDVTCPKCGLLEKERYDFIPQAAESARINMIQGSYTPMVWWVGSYADHVLKIVFGILDAHANDDHGGFLSIANAYLNRIDWGEQAYANNHILRIACKVYEELNNRPCDWYEKS